MLTWRRLGKGTREKCATRLKTNKTIRKRSWLMQNLCRIYAEFIQKLCTDFPRLAKRCGLRFLPKFMHVYLRLFETFLPIDSRVCWCRSTLWVRWAPSQRQRRPDSFEPIWGSGSHFPYPRRVPFRDRLSRSRAFEAVAYYQWSSHIFSSTDTVKWRKMIDIDHQPKQLDHQVEAVACHQ